MARDNIVIREFPDPVFLSASLLRDLRVSAVRSLGVFYAA